MVFYGFRSTKPENFRSKITVTRRHAQPEDPTIISVFSRAVTRRRRPLTRFTRSTRQALTHAPSAMTSRMTSPSLTGLTDLETGPGPNRLPKKKKRKKERENALTWWTFDLDQKVKIFKPDLSHSIFRVHSEFGTHFFIRNSEIVQMSSFQKLTFAQMLTKK